MLIIFYLYIYICGFSSSVIHDVMFNYYASFKSNIFFVFDYRLFSFDS